MPWYIVAYSTPSVPTARPGTTLSTPASPVANPSTPALPAIVVTSPANARAIRGRVRVGRLGHYTIRVLPHRIERAAAAGCVCCHDGDGEAHLLVVARHADP